VAQLRVVLDPVLGALHRQGAHAGRLTLSASRRVAVDAGEGPGGCSAPASAVKFAVDSLLEGDGFEPSVPRQRTLFETAPFELAFPTGRERDRGFESLFCHHRVWLREF
jgi:hypothetical protein